MGMVRQLVPSLQLDAALDWALATLGDGASIAEMRALCQVTLACPKDAIHRHWATVLLNELEALRLL